MRDIAWSSPKFINYDGKKITLDIEIQTYLGKTQGGIIWPRGV